LAEIIDENTYIDDENLLELMGLIMEIEGEY